MTPAEASLLVTNSTLVYLNLVTGIPFIVLYGIFLPSCGVALYLALQEKRQSKAILVIVIVLLLTMTLTLVCAVVYIVMSCKYMFIENTAWSKGDSINKEAEVLDSLLSDHTFNWLVAEEWLGVVPHNHSPSCQLTASLCFTAVLFICDGTFDAISLNPSSPLGSTIPWDLASGFLSLTVNIITTSSIIMKVWYYWKSLPRGYRQTPAQQILLLWAESGALYCAVQLPWAIFQALAVNKVQQSPEVLAEGFLTNLTAALGGLYPISVFIVVKQKVSLLDETVQLETHMPASRTS
ncbi:hypothetical protein BT96DRAFT_937118 [Gymnopus androsaceus JB14]|uniref:Uncharacterized protein n=1 Tax=Gymnopus androsaceus JB14 TaxID=1447944 RepID=A0A6A4HX94_9AGAR|nr:hypothetical protein BT96DRAFT_937118 [Gymnopus androsaceus JB14]